MTGRLAVDFGTSNTVLALWDNEKKESHPCHLQEYTRIYHQGGDSVPVVPTLIHYSEDRRLWIGNQVLTRNLYHSRRTIRWMKRYISQRSPIKVNLGDRMITPFAAGSDFLSLLLNYSIEQLEIRDEEIVLSIPVESYEHYEEWLSTFSTLPAGLRFRFIDEPSAAALGYGASIQPGQAVLIFDFGGGTMHASVVIMETEPNAASGRRCRVLGKAGKYIGGATIDQWLFQEVLARHGRQDYEDSIRVISNALLVACEKTKEELTFSDSSDIGVIDPSNQELLQTTLTRSDFEEILDRHDLYTEIGRTIRAALNSSRERGYGEDAIQAVLLVGGSSAIPSVQRTIRQMLGKERLYFNHPIDAVARGAAAFAAGVDFSDHIQHNYAIRYVNPATGAYDYRVIIDHGTSFPSLQPAARLVIKAAFDGQKQLGLAIFEMGEAAANLSQAVELIFDASGAARLAQVTPHEIEQRQLFWMNEYQPTFLTADPPGKQGEPRFEVEFRIDANKRLIFSARDLASGNLVYQDFPVVKLT